VVLQGLFFNEDLVAPLALVLPCRIMAIEVHTHRAGLGRREITFGTRIQPRLIFCILALAWQV
jgi:hypothetical protein